MFCPPVRITVSPTKNPTPLPGPWNKSVSISMRPMFSYREQIKATVWRVAIRGFDDNMWNRNICVLLGFVIACTLLSLCIPSLLLAHQAGSFLRSVEKINIGSNDTESVMRLRSRYSAYLDSNTDCDPNQCEVEFIFRNSAWNRLGFGKPTWLIADFHLENNVVKHLHLAYAVAITNEAASSVHIDEFPPSTPGGMRVELKTRASKEIPFIYVSFTRNIAPRSIQGAFKLKTSCLVPFRWCRDAFDLAPWLAKQPNAHILDAVSAH